MFTTTAAHLRPRPGLRPSPPLRRPAYDLRALWGDAFVFLISACSFLDITVIGQLPYSEILILLLLPALLATNAKTIFSKEFRALYILMGLWLLSQVITDIYMDTPSNNRAKGIARIVFFAIDVMALSPLIGANLRRIKLFFLGLAIAGCAGWLVHPPALGGFAVAWKFGVAVSVATFLLLIASYEYPRKGKHSVSVIILLAFAGLDLYYGARSAELIFAAAAVLLLLRSPASKQGRGAPRNGRWVKVALLLVAGAGTVWLSQQAIHWMVQSGFYSQAETAKFETQSGGKLGLLFGGRPEGPIAVRAIMDSPILGHGSYAPGGKYLIMLQDLQYEWGYSSTDAAFDSDEPEGIPSHSHLTGAWVEAGFLGGVFWFYMLGLTVRSVLRLTEIRHPLAPLYLLAFMGLFWDILFSPFGNTRRITEAFMIVLMVNLLRRPPAKIRTGLRLRQGDFIQGGRILWRPPLRPGAISPVAGFRPRRLLPNGRRGSGVPNSSHPATPGSVQHGP